MSEQEQTITVRAFTLQGRVNLRDVGDAIDILHVGDVPLAGWVGKFSGRQALFHAVLGQGEEISADGDVLSVYRHHYSEDTGYLWTDEEAEVGQTNLIDTFTRHIGEHVTIAVYLDDGSTFDPAELEDNSDWDWQTGD